MVLAPTTSDIDLLTALTAVRESTLWGNHRLFDPLLALHNTRPFPVLSINQDAIVLSFVDLVKDADELAETSIRLFPFLRDYHTASAANPDDIDVRSLLAEEMCDNNAIDIVYQFV